MTFGASGLRGRREIAGAIAYWSGLAHAYQRVARPTGAIVLMYHSVAADPEAPGVDPRNRVAPATFERQMAFLAAHRTVVPLPWLVEAVGAGEAIRPGTVAITLDDGYRDNLTVAAPILARHRLPATLFLATGYVTAQEPQWVDRLHVALTTRTANTLLLEPLGPRAVALDSEPGGAAARAALKRLLLEAPMAERSRLLGEVERQLRPSAATPRLTLSWDEVRRLRETYPGIELGGHTRDHLDLRTHVGQAAREQIRGCLEDLVRETGARPRHFSFPYGRWREETRAMVLEEGWASAVGSAPGVRVDRGRDVFAIPRIEVGPSMTTLRFATSGANPGVLRLLGVRAS